MVGEEDSNKQINDYVEYFIDGNKKYSEKMGSKNDIPTYFHAGETNKRHALNLHDSILLGAKRIGHGF